MITNLVLKNFKCFESQSFDMRNFTLLAGLNGMGKSSVLQALLLIRQSYLDGLLPDTGLELNGSLVKMGTAQDVLYEDAQNDEFEIGISWDDETTAEFIIQYFREADVLGIASSPNRSIFTRAPFTDGFHYLQAERLGPRLTNAVSDYQVREHRQIGTTGSTHSTSSMFTAARMSVTSGCFMQKLNPTICGRKFKPGYMRSAQGQNCTWKCIQRWT